MTRRWLGLWLLAAACSAVAAPPGATWVSPALAEQTLEAALPSRFDVRLKDGSTAGLGSCADVTRLDATITEDTVVETQDAGPAAKASSPSTGIACAMSQTRSLCNIYVSQ